MRSDSITVCFCELPLTVDEEIALMEVVAMFPYQSDDTRSNTNDFAIKKDLAGFVKWFFKHSANEKFVEWSSLIP